MWGKKADAGSLPGTKNVTANSNDVLERLAVDYMRDRKWRRIFRFVIFVLVIWYLFNALNFTAKQSGFAGATVPHTALIELNGVIGGEGVYADQINSSLRQAFASKLSKGVVLRINSPGGSPVQSDEINAEVTRLLAKYPNKSLYVVVSDICASGGYYIAAAADKIYANPSSIVGSIGVRMDSFGFVGALEKLGVERRSLTAGENKSILDPFLPIDSGQREHAKQMLDIVHQEFIDVVKAGRGAKLADDPDLFSGLFWSGRQAKELGLVDEFGTLDFVAREVIGQENVVDYSYRPDFWEQFPRDLGVSIGRGVANVLGGGISIQ